MAKIEIRTNTVGGRTCLCCGERGEMPYIVWVKICKMGRGSSSPMCSMECAERYAENLRRVNVKEETTQE